MELIEIKLCTQVFCVRLYDKYVALHSQKMVNEQAILSNSNTRCCQMKFNGQAAFLKLKVISNQPLPLKIFNMLWSRETHYVIPLQVL